MKQAIVLASVLMAATCAFAGDLPQFAAGVRIWDRQEDLSEIEDLGGSSDLSPFYGVFASAYLTNDVFVSAFVAFRDGEFEIGNDRIKFDYAVTGEVIAGKRLKQCDVGAGLHVNAFKLIAESGNTEVDSYSDNSYGPVVYVGFGGPILDSVINWFGTAVAGYELGGDSDGFAVTPEAGIGYSNDFMLTNVGYRYKIYDDGDSAGGVDFMLGVIF